MKDEGKTLLPTDANDRATAELELLLAETRRLIEELRIQLERSRELTEKAAQIAETAKKGWKKPPARS